MDYHTAARIHHEAKAQAYGSVRMRRKAEAHAERAAEHARFGGVAADALLDDVDAAKKAFLAYAQSKGYEGDKYDVYRFEPGTYPDLHGEAKKLSIGDFTFHTAQNRDSNLLVAEKKGKRLFDAATSDLHHVRR